MYINDFCAYIENYMGKGFKRLRKKKMSVAILGSNSEEKGILRIIFA